MTTDRTTRAELRATITERDAEVAKLRDEVDAWKKVAPNDAEAHAIARCVVALDKLPKSSRSTYSIGSGGPDEAAVGRVLRYLAGRFGVAL